ncbi:hypothetical protein RhiirC2_795808 [Rhizophagus irregularis]|uniref:Uncharacterized protein n=1 Tax=Rhizophagus irregularis TaxID=588596 RepID=A0A2N1MAT6_9GLOM|nr:hypothetical protein RhiirC2_795808 [Rhizophagus irregularis]
MLYLFVTAYENGISLVKSAVVGIKESGNFEDLLDKLVKVDLQCNDFSAWHPVLNGLTENLEYSLIVKASRSILQILYQDLTKDVSTPDNKINKKTHEQIKLILDTQDPDIIVNLRKIINEKGTKFDVF